MNWYVTSNTVLHQEFGERCIEFLRLQFIDFGDVIAEFEVFAMDSRASISEVSAADFSIMGCPRMGNMLTEVFGSCKKIDNLKYKVGWGNELVAVRRIYWVEDIWVADVDCFNYMIHGFVDFFRDRLIENKGVLILGFYVGIESVFDIMEDLGFRDIGELDCRFVKRGEGIWNVRYEMFLSER